MSEEAMKLRQFVKIYKSLQEMEAAYIELEEFGVDYCFSEYFNSNLSLSDVLEKTVDAKKLTLHKLKQYRLLNENIYDRLKYDYPQLHSIGNNINDIFFTAYKELEKTIENQLKPDKKNKRPFFACGFTSLTIIVPEYTLLGIMLEDKLFSPEHFTYSSGAMTVDISAVNKKFSLTSQEYEVYEKAYEACLRVLKEGLNINGSIYSCLD